MQTWRLGLSVDTILENEPACIPVEKQLEGMRNSSYMINKIYQADNQKVQQIKQEGLGERQDRFIHYLVANELKIDLFWRALLEQVALHEFEMQGEAGKDVARAARDTIRQMDTQIEQEIQLWHRAYLQSRIVVNYFVLGVEKYTENVLEESLELLTASHVVNKKIAEEPPQTRKGFKVRSRLQLYHPDHYHDAGHIHGMPHQALPPGSRDRVRPCGQQGVHHLGSRHPNPAVQDKQEARGKGGCLAGGGDGGGDRENLYNICGVQVWGSWCAMMEQPLPVKKRHYWVTISTTVVPIDNSSSTLKVLFEAKEGRGQLLTCCDVEINPGPM